eukprot:CAMPEP_0169399086 /NCGR_PEP_ID=MMETSP1017-20121227/52999_1 /TAXON_ID=342587 /ORGANISM="Karlodinium micrum, Strain CCMP2283" /LENGTH=111 /DNA_ID=CAMNT_0009504139 /DNA_START=157 /DNA_END=492 /DNA_ORIENTATION=+
MTATQFEVMDMMSEGSTSAATSTTIPKRERTLIHDKQRDWLSHPSTAANLLLLPTIEIRETINAPGTTTIGQNTHVTTSASQQIMQSACPGKGKADAGSRRLYKDAVTRYL